MLADLLCAWGFACGAVQPDVSGHTIMNLLDQTRGEAELILPALGSLYEDVSVKTQTETELTIDLGRGQAPFAFVTCASAPSPASCVFRYRDNVRQVEEFLGQSSRWALQEVGPLTQEGTGDDLFWQARNADQEVVLTLLDEKQASVTLRWLR